MPQHRDDKPKSQMDAAQNRGRGRQQGDVGRRLREGTMTDSQRAAHREQGWMSDQEGSAGARGSAEQAHRDSIFALQPPETQTPTDRRAGLRVDSPAIQQGLIRIGTDDTASQDRAAEAVAGLRRGPGGFLAQPTEEGVTQFKRRQHLDAARDRHALEREAFGQARGLGRAETAARRSLRGRDRMDEVLRRNAMDDEDRESEANLIAGAAQSDAEQLREARGLRQDKDLKEQELGVLERNSQRDFQASLAGTNARTQQQQAEAQREFQQEEIDTGFSVAQGIVTETNPELAENPAMRGQYDLFVSETNKDQLNKAAPFNLRGEDMGGLFAIASLMPELDAGGIFPRTPDRPVSAGQVLELINRAAQQPGVSEIDMGRGKIAVSKLEGLAGGLFDQYVSRARTGFENQVVENVLRGNDLDGEQQKFVEGELRQFKEEQKSQLPEIPRSTSLATSQRSRRGQPQEARDVLDRGTAKPLSEEQTQQMQQQLAELGIEAGTPGEAREAIDNLSTEDYLPILARRTLARRGQ